MNLTRREAMAVGLGGVALGLLPRGALAGATEDAIAKFTGGAAIGTGGITLTAPEIAENGNTVPISVSAPGAEQIIVLAPGNPTPEVVTFKFGPSAGSQNAATRIRLAQTQDVTALAKMKDGKFVKVTQTVKVTVGGCGG